MPSRELFQQPESRRRSPLSGVASLVAHGALAAVAIWLGSIEAARPATTQQQRLTFMRVTLPAAPVEPIEPLRHVPPLETAVVEPPPAPETIVELPIPPEPPVPEAPPRPLAAEPPLTRPVVKVGEFAAALPPTRTVDERQVRTVEFALEQATATAVPNAITNVGTFQSPETNAKAGNDRREAIVAAGFGNVVAPSAPRRSAGTVSDTGFGANPDAPRAALARQAIKPSGFADAPVEPAAASRHRTEQTVTPLEVLFKPAPDYSPEARALKIEGTVTLEVEFSAAGQPRVLRVLRGLGRGLDEMAIRAAEQIRYKPAQSDGKPVDVTANVQIVFKLT